MIALLLSGCSHKTEKKTLYERLGGGPGVSLLVETFLGIVAEDLRIVARFGNADIDRLQQKLEEQICNISSGPCEYTGKDMRTTHDGMKITESEFNALVEDLQKSMDRIGLPVSTQNELIAKLAPMRADIIRR